MQTQKLPRSLQMERKAIAVRFANSLALSKSNSEYRLFLKPNWTISVKTDFAIALAALLMAKTSEPIALFVGLAAKYIPFD